MTCDVVVAFPISGLCVSPPFYSLTVPIWYSQLNSDFGRRLKSEVGAFYLSVSGPLDFRLVIQVLSSLCINMHAYTD